MYATLSDQKCTLEESRSYRQHRQETHYRTNNVLSARGGTLPNIASVTKNRCTVTAHSSLNVHHTNTHQCRITEFLKSEFVEDSKHIYRRADTATSTHAIHHERSQSTSILETNGVRVQQVDIGRVPIHKRIPPTTNFRVRVYRNGDRSRFVECKSCSMQILFQSATQKFQVSTMFKRLFDAYGCEIKESKDIIRGMEYYVSFGEDFIDPLNAIELQIQYTLHSRWTIYGIEWYYIRWKRHPQKEKPNDAKETTLPNKPDILVRQYLTEDRSTQINERLVQIEQPDCPKRHSCYHHNDDRKTLNKSSMTDPLPVVKPISTQHEQTNCPKQPQNTPRQDKPPVADQWTQTSPPKPKKERIDQSKSFSLLNQPDQCRSIVIECVDVSKQMIPSNHGDKLSTTVEERPDSGKSLPKVIIPPLQQLRA